MKGPPDLHCRQLCRSFSSARVRVLSVGKGGCPSGVGLDAAPTTGSGMGSRRYGQGVSSAGSLDGEQFTSPNIGRSRPPSEQVRGLALLGTSPRACPPDSVRGQALWIYSEDKVPLRCVPPSQREQQQWAGER